MSLKNAKINFLVDMATDLFMARSINEVTIKDIAVAAQVGEATIYRTFGSKQNIVVQSAMKLQAVVSSDYFKLEKGKTGYEKLALFYQSYHEIFLKHPQFYKFLNEFDAFISLAQNEDPTPYENAIEVYEEHYMEAYQLGIKDGSIKPQKDIKLFYFSTTHALLELCKKLAFKREVLKQDTLIEKDSEIQILIDVILTSLNNL